MKGNQYYNKWNIQYVLAWQINCPVEIKAVPFICEPALSCFTEVFENQT